MMIVTTANEIEGYRITEYLDIVRGIIVRVPNLKQGFLGGLKSVIGGQIGPYREMCEHARQEAHDLMMQHATELGADAVLGVRYDTGEISQGATEVLCYGSAVKLIKA